MEIRKNEQKIKNKLNEVWGVKGAKVYKIPETELSMVAEDDNESK